MQSLYRILFCAMLALLPAALARAQAPPGQQNDVNLVLLEVRLERHVIADAMTAYQIGRDIFLPLGELSKLLTLAIGAHPARGHAGGYILSEDRVFNLDVIEREVTVDGQRMPLDRSQIKLQSEDIYVASRLLAQWLPVELEVDLPSLSVTVRPREKLPMQASLDRLERGKKAGARGAGEAHGFPDRPVPYRMLDVPFIDQTIGVNLSSSEGRRHTDSNYSAYLTSDLLGMQAALFATTSARDRSERLRLTLGRHEPGAGLLGPLNARTAFIGAVPVPGLPHVSHSHSSGNGFTVSNRPLNQPTRFDQHTLEGDLPPGWDVELYYNEALVGFQQSRPDGKYVFKDQPLAYGPNEFRLVFHGPLGQLRVERHSFLLEQSAVAPGALYYSVTEQHDADGNARSLAQFEWGIGSHLSASAAAARLPVAGVERRYAQAGLYGYLNSFILSGEAARADNGGTLAQVALKTRIGNVSVAASHARLDDFTSELYQPTSDPVQSRDEIRADGFLTPAPGLILPLSLHVRRDTLASHAENTQVQGRISAYRDGTALSNALRWQSMMGNKYVDGLLQVSRRVAGFGLNGQLAYGISPETELNTVAISADYYIDHGYMANLGLSRSFANPHYRLTGGLNKSLGSFGFGVSGFYTSRREYGAGVQLFMSMGLEPRAGRVMTEAQPMANTGAASLRVFLDRNLNGVMDNGDEPVKGAGFTLNGGNHMARTDARGVAYLTRLPAYQGVDIGLDDKTLEDPQWQPQVRGLRVVPRPGKVVQLDFALSITGEVDGTTWLMAGGARKPVGDLQLELIGPDRKVAATMKSASDGYYVIPAVFPGTYLLRVAPAQLKRLGLQDTGMHLITIGADGTFLNARDFIVVAGEL